MSIPSHLVRRLDEAVSAARSPAPSSLSGALMLLIREVFNCHPGKVKPMVEKFRTMARLSEKAGQGKVRILTDFVAERYWTIVAEFEVENLEAFEKMMSGQGQQMSPEDQKAMEQVFTGYHDLVVKGRREIWKIEG